MADCKILFVGGGSNAWTVNIVKDLMLTESLKGSEIVLYDINKKASDRNKVLLNKLMVQLNLPFKITSTDKPAVAFKGVNYIVITVSTGGLDSMAHDLSIPEEYGIYHTVGDTSGPGGWARSIRNFDTFVELAKKINKYCPGAFILNYSNPMICLTDILQQLCRGPVIGLCHGLFENVKVLKNTYKTDDASQIHLKYAGLNHFHWITEARYKNINIIEDFKKRLKTKGLSDIIKFSKADPMGFKSGRAVADELFRMTGVMPYFGDRHTCEYFSWFITSRKNIKQYNIKQTSVKQRWAAFNKRDNELEKVIRGKIPGYLLKKSCETAADIIDAHYSGKQFIDVGNTKNIGQVSNLPMGTVVETACMIDKNGVAPITFGALPEIVAGFCRPHANVFNMTVKACMEKDRQLALEALRLDPVCSHLNSKQVKELGEKLLKAHKNYIRIF